MKNKFKSCRLLTIIFCAGSLVATQFALADSMSWTGAFDTDFNTADNWSTAVPGEPDTAAFNGVAPTNLPILSGALTILGITFDATSAGYTLSSSGPALTLTDGTAISSAATGGTNIISSDLVLGGALGGTQWITRTNNGSLTLSGVISGTDATATTRFNSTAGSSSGAMTISGTNNSYPGNTLITGSTDTGIVAVASIGNTGANSSVGAGNIVNIGAGSTGGILRYTGTGETLGVSGKTINLNGTTGGGTIDTTGNAGALIVGAGRLTFDGSGNKTLTLTGSSTWGDTIQADIVNSTGTTTLTKKGTGTWTLTGNNTFTGNVTIGQGALIVSSIGNSGSTTSNLGAGTTINLGTTSPTGGALRYTGTGEISNRAINMASTSSSNTIDNSGVTGALELTANITASGGGTKSLTLTGTNTGDNKISGSIANNSETNTTALVKSGTGTWVIAGDNSAGYSGGTTVNQGLLGITNNNALGSGTLSFAAPSATPDIGTGQVFASGADVTLANSVKINNGSGSTYHTSTATFSGNYSITIGGNVTSSTNSGSTATRILNNNITAAGKSLTINGDYTNSISTNSNSFRITGSGNTIFNGAIHDSSAPKPTAVSYQGTGSLTLAGNTLGATSNPLTGSMSFSGAGTVNINSANALGTGVLNLSGSTINNTSGAAIVVASNNAININADFTFGTEASTSANNLTFGTGNITGWNDTRIITLAGTGTTLAFGGNLVAPIDNSRTLTVNGAGNTLSFSGATITTSVNTGRTLTINGTGNVTSTGTISNGSAAGNVTYSGTGQLTLAGTNDYTGITTVSSGTLLVTGAITDTSRITASGGTVRLGVSDAIGDVDTFPPVTLSGGTLDAQTFSDTLGALTLSGNSFISLSGGQLAFAASNSISWGAPGTFTIDITGFALNSLRFGTDNTGLTGDQLASFTADGYDTFTLTETGYLTAVPTSGGGYASWETTNGIAGAGADVDSDNDGIANGIEFVIGGDPSGPGSDSNSLLPTVTVDATYLNFVFRRTDGSASCNPFVEYGQDLTGWTKAEDTVNGVIITPENDIEVGVDRITAQIPRALAAPGSKLFARLRMTAP